MWSGRRRLSMFGRNLFRFGLLGRSILFGHAVARLYGADLSRLLEARSITEQRRFFELHVAPLFQKRLVRWATSQPLSLYGLGIPPAQYGVLAASGDGAMAGVLQERLEKLACGFPLRENYFAWQAFGRSYAPGASGPLPLYLQARNYANIRLRAERVEVRHASCTDVLNAMQPSSADRFVLLDAQDWMTDGQLSDLWSGINHAASRDARVIFRTAGRDSILPDRVPESILAKWRYLPELSSELGKRDRSSV